jgi:hypothetical protein
MPSQFRQPQEDLLRPSKRQTSRTLARSWRTWHELQKVAQSTTHYPPSCIDTSNLLHQTPSIPSQFCIEGIVEDGVLSLEGYPQWSIGSSTGCDLDSETKRSRLQRINIGVENPAVCTTGDHFSRPTWLGFESLPDSASRGNYILPMALG